jgi:hypothetical protein
MLTSHGSKLKAPARPAQPGVTRAREHRPVAGHATFKERKEVIGD